MISGVRRLALGTVILVVTGVLAATTAGPADPISGRARLVGPSKCISDNIPYGRDGNTPIFRELQTLRVRVWMSALYWVNVAPRRPANPRLPDDPAYVWPALLDGTLKEARAHGIEPVLYVNTFPPWSNGGRDQTWAATNPADFADFMAAAVRRYPQVRRWIVFSEPSHVANFQPQGGKGRLAPRTYARLLDAAYRAMHAVRRDVVVIGGNVHVAGSNDHLTTAPDTFLRHMVLPNGRRPRLDMFGLNPYTERPINMALPKRPRYLDFNDLDWLLRQLDRYWPRRRLQLFIEEFGWNTEHAGRGWLFVVSRKEQARRLSKAYSVAARFRRINTMCWTQLVDQPPERVGSVWLNWTTGLRTWDGEKKPSWWAFARVRPGPIRSR